MDLPHELDPDQDEDPGIGGVRPADRVRQREERVVAGGGPDEQRPYAGEQQQDLETVTYA
jgi:hypothetical protein